jgi:hypothetical protein
MLLKNKLMLILIVSTLLVACEVDNRIKTATPIQPAAPAAASNLVDSDKVASCEVEGNEDARYLVSANMDMIEVKIKGTDKTESQSMLFLDVEDLKTENVILSKDATHLREHKNTMTLIDPEIEEIVLSNSKDKTRLWVSINPSKTASEGDTPASTRPAETHEFLISDNATKITLLKIHHDLSHDEVAKLEQAVPEDCE